MTFANQISVLKRTSAVTVLAASWILSTPMTAVIAADKTYDQRQWMASSVIFEFDDALLQHYGVAVTTRADSLMSDGGPRLPAVVLPSSTVKFNTDRSVAEFDGEIQTRGAVMFIAGDRRLTLGNLVVTFGPDGPALIRSTLHGNRDVLHVGSSTTDSQGRSGEIHVASELFLTPSIAAELGQPELAKDAIGRLLIEAHTILVTDNSTPSGSELAPTRHESAVATTIGPDVIVGSLQEVNNYGSSSGISAFSVGTISCNIGDFWLNWNDSTNQHPVIGGNMYRLKNGRFEQVGQSWLKHGFFALSQNLCFSDCQSTDGGHLGVHCSDPYSASLNGTQSNLGPKYQVNPTTGFFTYPPANPSYSGNIARRLQVRNSDLDPAQNGGGSYFVEGQYVSPDDAAAGNQNNNASWRPMSVSGSGSNWTIALNGTTHRQEAAIRAWKAADAQVVETNLQVAGDGLFIISAKATSLGGGIWHYEYAVQNLNSHRAARAFSIPIDATAQVQNVGFHDVDYHSGEPFATTDWTSMVSGNTVTWSTQDFNTNQNANALRWGTLYNFRFDCNRQPQTVNATIEMFRPGSPLFQTVSTVGPVPSQADCNNNGVPDTIDISTGTSADCDNDGRPDECQIYGIMAAPIVSGLDRPLYLTASDKRHIFVVEQGGKIKVLVDGILQTTPFLDISSLVNSTGEQGLLSTAFAPNYPTSGHFYVTYTNLAGELTVARYSVSANPNVANPASAVILKTIPQDSPNHPGGQLQFGPNGALYVGTGDGGNANDPLNRGQDTGALLGKILALDVNNPPTYVYGGNPFTNPGLPLDEIWAFGLRNPRFSFDRGTGDLYIADVGQGISDEIDFQPSNSNGGQNYGWRCMEGNECTGLSGCTCHSGALTPPVLDVPRESECSRLIGGYSYRGCMLPSYLGKYFYADYCTGAIRSFRYFNGQATEQADHTAALGPLGGTPQAIVSFGQDFVGELYVVSKLGSVYKFVRAAFCGNNVLEVGEECDDGNNQSLDGCDANCHFETGPANDDCVSASPINEGAIGFQTSDASTDGPNEAAVCGVGSMQNPLGFDVWFCYTATCTGTATASLCGTTSYDSMIAVYNDCTCPTTPSATSCKNDTCGLNASVSFAATACESRLIRVGGFNNSVGSGTLSITCTPEPLVNDCDGNQIDDATDISCGTHTDVNANGVPDICETAGDRLRGGRLYDTWWQELGSSPPATDHVLWQYRPDPVTNTATGAGTWRCNECHGWDYGGAAGVYGSGEHHTGFAGIRGTQRSGAELFDLLKQPASNGGGAGLLNGHNLGSVIPDANIDDLVAFVLLGTVDADALINPLNGDFLGDPAQGGAEYTGGGTQTHCVSCHGSDGASINLGTPSALRFLGTTANDDPWRFLHRTRMGAPGSAMNAWLAAGGTDQGAADIGRYAQLHFPTDCVNDGQCDDGIACTSESCNATGQCVYVPHSEMCTDDTLFCNGLEVCDLVNGCISAGNPCGNPLDCDESANSCGCLSPIVTAAGGRYLAVSPQAKQPTVAMALVVTAECPSGQTKYVGPPSGPNNVAYLVDNRSQAASLTPAQWGGTLYISGVDMAPGLAYGVRADCGLPSNPAQTDAASANLHVWGDVIGRDGPQPDGVSNVADIAAVVDGFRGVPTARPVYNLDLFGCVPNQRIDIVDVAGAVDAFRGVAYQASLCPGPCW